MSHRPDQVASAIRRVVSSGLTRLSDERIKGLVSVTSVDVSPDLRQATINVSVLPEEHARTALRGLRNAATRLRSELARSVRLRRVPHLEFAIDRSLKQAAELDRAIAEARGGGQGDEEADHADGDARGEARPTGMQQRLTERGETTQ